MIAEPYSAKSKWLWRYKKK